MVGLSGLSSEFPGCLSHTVRRSLGDLVVFGHRRAVLSFVAIGGAFLLHRYAAARCCRLDSSLRAADLLLVVVPRVDLLERVLPSSWSHGRSTTRPARPQRRLRAR